MFRGSFFLIFYFAPNGKRQKPRRGGRKMQITVLVLVPSVYSLFSRMLTTSIGERVVQKAGRLRAHQAARNHPSWLGAALPSEPVTSIRIARITARKAHHRRCV